jgi:tripartite-type tricarboxylate transporter receptor subunit TctC
MIRALVALLLLCFGLSAWPQSYPTRTVRIIVPYGVGGSADVYGRYLAAKLSDSVGQSVVVENRPGGGSIVGTDVVAKSEPDGYTLLVMSNTHTVNETLIPKKPFDLMRDFAPITGVSYSDLLMVVHPSVAASNLKEFIALAKSKPGDLNYASSGNVTHSHIAAPLF